MSTHATVKNEVRKMKQNLADAEEKLEVLRIEKEEKLQKAVALLNSMVEGGEQHSETSRSTVRDALDS